MSDEKKPMENHEYDGIQELDNQLPEWWLFIFAGTIIFAFVYYVHYEIAGGMTSDQRLAESMALIKGQQKQGPVLNEDALAKAFSADTVTAGTKVFADKCAVCHGPQGGGVIGPNLTDNFWINGKGTREDIHHVISAGVPAKGMPAWQGVLPDDEVIAVTSFVYSLKGTHISGGKEAQGVEVK